MSLELKILNLLNKKEYGTQKQQRILDILKVVLVDKETDIDKIVNLTSTTPQTIEKYAYDKELMSQFLTEAEYIIFIEKVDDIFYLKKHDIEEDKKIKNVVDDIFNTRHKLSEICRKNCISINKIENLIYKTNYLDDNFGLGTNERIKAKLSENGLIRQKKLKNLILIEDRWDVFVSNPEIYYLNELDFKKLKIASSYLCSGADINYVTEKHEISVTSVIASLSDLKLQTILKPNYYENLKRYINIEKVLINNELSVKKTLLFNIIHILNESNYDKRMVQTYFNLPVCLFNKLLKEILELPYFDQEVKENIKSLLNMEEDKKVK